MFDSIFLQPTVAHTLITPCVVVRVWINWHKMVFVTFFLKKKKDYFCTTGMVRSSQWLTPFSIFSLQAQICPWKSAINLNNFVCSKSYPSWACRLTTDQCVFTHSSSIQMRLFYFFFYFLVSIPSIFNFMWTTKFTI